MLSLIQGLILLSTFSATNILVDTAAVRELEATLVVDARSAEAFAAGHIPGAAHLDVNSLSEERDGVVGMLKPRAALVPLFAEAGLNPKKTLVVYSGMEEASDLKQATRLFWALEYSGFSDVKLLDGGLRTWRAEGHPVESGPSQVMPLSHAHFSGLEPMASRLATKDEVMAAQKTQKGIISDSRANALYTGESKKAFIARGGHIKSAINQPVASFVDESKLTFKTPAVIQEYLSQSTKDVETPVITYCNTGRDATIGYAAYRIAGFENVAMYDGSMAEWGNLDACPVSKGSDK